MIIRMDTNSLKVRLAAVCLLIACIGPFILPSSALAQGVADVVMEDGMSTVATSSTPAAASPPDAVFEAVVRQVIEEKTVPRADGSRGTQQKLRLEGLEGPLRGQSFVYDGISEIDAVSANVYRVGDRVLVGSQAGADGRTDYYVADHVRRAPLYWLFALFILAVLAVSGGKGLRSLLGLGLSFGVIMGVMVPLILKGWDPLIVGTLSAAAVFVGIVYLSEGFGRKAHLATLSAVICLAATALLSLAFTWWSRLTGMAQEETMFLIGLGRKAIDFQGLFLAGVLVGALGVLDDMILGQIEAVARIREANPKLPAGRVAHLAMQVGKTHIGAMVNTLFLAYAGASLPLLILFSVREPPFLTFAQILNNETVAAEVVRTLVGSIGLVMAMPVSTYLAARYWCPEKPYEPGRGKDLPAS